MTSINSIKVFGRATCAPCKTIRYYLEKKNLKHEYIDVDQDPQSFQEVANKSGTTIVPQTLVAKTIDGQEMEIVISGLNLAKIASL